MKFNWRKLFQKMGVIDPDLTAEKVHLQNVYSAIAQQDPTFEGIKEKKIKELEEKIRNSNRWDGERVYIESFSSRQLALYKAMKREFEGRGFNISFATGKEIPALKDSNLFIISWDIVTKEEEELLN